MPVLASVRIMLGRILNIKDKNSLFLSHFSVRYFSVFRILFFRSVLKLI